jgi:hypothetical protein
MPLPPEQYLARAEDLEAAAARVGEAAIKHEYSELAAQYRDMAKRLAQIRNQTSQLDLIAERMVARFQAISSSGLAVSQGSSEKTQVASASGGSATNRKTSSGLLGPAGSDYSRARGRAT